MFRRIAIALIVFFTATSPAHAGHLIGPIPYLSQADSPFDLSGLGATMFLEDFEEGAPVTPGIPAKYGVFIQPPGPFTDSVDADDGAIDGQGNAGYSLRSLGTTIEFTNPPRFYHDLPIDIDTEALGFVPNQFGFVLTDGPPLASVRINLLSDERQVLKTYTWGQPFVEPLLDNSFDGGTAEDLFFGIYEPEGITRIGVDILTRDETVGSFEIDHVQYGLAVPEPTSNYLALTAALVAIAFRFGQMPRSCCFPFGN